MLHEISYLRKIHESWLNSILALLYNTPPKIFNFHAKCL